MVSRGHAFGFGPSRKDIGNVSARLLFPVWEGYGIAACIVEGIMRGSWEGCRKPLRGGRWNYRKGRCRDGLDGVDTGSGVRRAGMVDS